MKFLWKLLKFYIIFFLLLYVGLIIGYSVIGDGDLIDAVSLSAVKHMVNLLRM
ncbi:MULTISPECIES: DNA-directed RNA polymerase subunit beta [unclassified Gemella]|uniref:DNA-directed RNA polymerase subunit beta n=1 Tax=unclassified Gemella TaxID=2624949 RepID=UPI0015CF8DA4|nr:MULTISPECIES: DNA-directed RNA polymerase subunit beta [unclassified Gemella]MBF0710306.1 DNA-directed RNA polymerase subunit beta [Gemella sp. GL1.1]NYS27650.1 DNA-directed RNA polymerase subunit beta [Gemella sp. GL1]